MKYFVVDAFTDSLFKGNPAGVCLLDRELDSAVLQQIAFENNLFETAFLLEKDGALLLRWFTPRVEIDLCGHATLATAFVYMNFVKPGAQEVEFKTKSGVLTVAREDGQYVMNFPARPPKECEPPAVLREALGVDFLNTYMSSRDLLVVLGSQADVQRAKPNLKLLKSLKNVFGTILTAEGTDADFVSRFFAPNSGIDEDPVTGSSHCTLVPYWAQKLGKSELVARQLSPRGGVLYCRDLGDRVKIGGRAVCYLQGEIQI